MEILLRINELRKLCNIFELREDFLYEVINKAGLITKRIDSTEAGKILGFSSDFIRQTIVNKHNLLPYTVKQASRNKTVSVKLFEVYNLIELYIFLIVYTRHCNSINPSFGKEIRFPKSTHRGLTSFVESNNYVKHFSENIRGFVFKLYNEKKNRKGK